jgi:hypothetical protein
MSSFVEHLGVDFISFVFDLIESPPDTDVEEQIPDLFLNLILAYNLQFVAGVENLMLKALLQRPLAKTFTEKTLLLLNREGEERVDTFVATNCSCFIIVIINGLLCSL